MEKRKVITQRAFKLKKEKKKEDVLWWDRYNAEQHLIEETNIQPVLEKLANELSNHAKNLENLKYYVEYDKWYGKNPNTLSNDTILFSKVARDKMEYLNEIKAIESILKDMKRIGKMVEFPMR